MTLSDEMLMAYADGELDATERAEVEAAMALDPDIARRVQEHQALRKQLGGTYDRVLLETVPDRLIVAARGVSSPAKADSVRVLSGLPTDKNRSRRGPVGVVHQQTRQKQIPSGSCPGRPSAPKVRPE